MVCPLADGATPSLRGNLSWVLAGNIFYAACQWAIIVAVAKLGSPATVGQLTLGFAVCAPIVLFSGLSLRAVQSNDARRERPFSVYFGLRLVTTALALLAIGVVALLGGYRRETAIVIVLVGAAKAAEIVSDVFWGRLQQQELMKTISISMIIKGALSLLVLSIVLGATGSLISSVLGFAAVWLLVLLVYDLPAGRRHFGESLRPSFAPRSLASLAWLALPLGVVLMLISVAGNVPRYFIVHYCDEAELGVFSAIASLVLAGTVMMSALGQTVSPRLARYHAERDRGGFTRLVRVLVLSSIAVGASGALIAAVAGRPILRLVFGAVYADSNDVFVVVMISGISSYLLIAFGTVVTAANLFRVQVPLQCLNVAVVILGSWIAVPRWGAVGAAWVLVASNTITAIGFAFLTWLCIRQLTRSTSL